MGIKYIDGSLDIGGAVTVHDDISVPGDVHVDGDLAVEGILKNGHTFYNVAHLKAHTDALKEIVIKTKIPFINSNIMPLIHITGYTFGEASPVDLSVVFYILNNGFSQARMLSSGGCTHPTYLSTYIDNEQEYVAVSLDVSEGNNYFARFNVDFVDLWRNSTGRTEYAQGWTIETKLASEEGSIIPTANKTEVIIAPIASSITGKAAAAESANKLKTLTSVILDGAIAARGNTFDGTQNQYIWTDNVKESFLAWGGRNLSGAVSPIDAAMSDVHRANRLAFSNPDGITIEYSRDGTTYLPYDTTDESKIALVSGLGHKYDVGARAGGNSVNDKLRITLNSIDMGVYCWAKKLLLYVTSSTATASVTLEEATVAAPNTWITIGTYPISGWSGWNSIPLLRVFGTNGSNSTQKHLLRLTFGITELNADANFAFRLDQIVMLADTAWNTPSEMARMSHLYRYNANQDAIFPADVQATTFHGALNGKASSAAAADTLHDTAMNAGFMKGSATQPVYFDNGVPVACTHSLNATVPSNAKFTDTTYNEVTTATAGLMSANDKQKLNGIAAGANKYELPEASSTLGGVKTTSTVTSTSGLTACPIISGVPYYKNTTYSNMTAATSTTAGKAGLVPAPAAGKQNSYLRGDGTWAVLTELRNSSGNIELSIDTDHNILQEGFNSLETAPNQGTNLINDGKNNAVFGDSHTVDTVNSSSYNTQDSQSEDVNGCSNLIAGSCHYVSAGNSLIAGCWNVNQGDGHNSAVLGFDNLNSARNNLIAGSNHNVSAQSMLVAGNENIVTGSYGAGSSNNGGFGAVVGAQNEVKAAYALVAGYANDVGLKTGTAGTNARTTGGNFVAGRGNTVDGIASSALGQWNVVAHDYACAIGQGLITQGNHHIVVGRYNASGTANDIFTVGTGSDGARRTAFKVRSYETRDIINLDGELNYNSNGNYGAFGIGLTNTLLNGQILVGQYNNKDTSKGNAIFIVGSGSSTEKRTTLEVRDNGNLEVFTNTRFNYNSGNNKAIYIGDSTTDRILLQYNGITAQTTGYTTKICANKIESAGHLYLISAHPGSSTGNKSQIVFGAYNQGAFTEHLALSSNTNALVINPNTGETTNQIVLYLKQPSVFPSGIKANLTGNATTATTATKLGSANVGGPNQPIYLMGGVPQACTYNLQLATFKQDGANISTTPGLVQSGGDVTIVDGIITVNDDSHNHTIANVDGLQTELNELDTRINNLVAPTGTGWERMCEKKSLDIINGWSEYSFNFDHPEDNVGYEYMIIAHLQESSTDLYSSASSTIYWPPYLTASELATQKGLYGSQIYLHCRLDNQSEAVVPHLLSLATVMDNGDRKVILVCTPTQSIAGTYTYTFSIYRRKILY